MNIYELPESIKIARDFERENQEQQNSFNPTNLGNYTFYKILLDGKETGFASYRLRSPNYWYIDAFFINENYRRKKIGTYLLQHLIRKMRDEKNICIWIHPVKEEGFISFLLKNNFQDKEGCGDYFLYPGDEQ